MGAPVRILVVGLALGSLAGCEATTHRGHPSLYAEEGRLPGPVLVLPPRIVLERMSPTGMVEVADDWSTFAGETAERELRRATDELGLVRIDRPTLTTSERDLVAQHFDLCGNVVRELLLLTGDQARTEDEAWSHKAQDFDYGIGPGLGFLTERSGADTALLFLGYCQRPVRDGQFRKGYVPLPGDRRLRNSWLAVLLVDLRSGNILWFNRTLDRQDLKGSIDYRLAGQLERRLERMLESFPGNS